MNIKRTFDIVEQYHQKYNKEKTLVVKRYGKWETFSTEDYRKTVDYVSYGLLELGFKKGDKIANVSNNRPEWNFLDMGMAQIGAVHVPIYPTISEAEYIHIFGHSQAQILFLASEELYERVKPFADQVTAIKKIYSFDHLDNVPNFQEIIELGKLNEDKYKDQLVEIKAGVSEDDLCSIIYTSGTTGLSKGVMLSHKNFMSNVMSTSEILPLNSSHNAISFLPLCHVLERMVNYLYQYLGLTIYYAESVDQLGENINEISPHSFVTVPRLLERIYDKIYAKGQALTGIKRKLFFWAIELGEKHEAGGKNGLLYKAQLKIANKLIFSKWREALGNKIEVIIVGGAALQPRLARIFWAAGIPIVEGYGLTETSPVIAVNLLKYPYLKFGTVGPILRSGEVKIAKDGEILFKGPNLMMGYYNNPEKTKEAIDEDGWFHTGDIGEIHKHNILQITDRKKEIFKLSTGKYVAPQIVENRFKESPFIDQLMVVGESEKFAAAIISPNFEFLHDWCSLHKIQFRCNLDLIENPKILERYTKEVEELNKKCDKTRQMKKFELVCEAWTTDTGELSPTLKLKRRFVKKKYKTKIAKLYGHTDKVGHVVDEESC